MKRFAAVLVLVLAATGLGFAQDGFGKRGGESRVYWYPSLEGAMAGGSGGNEFEKRRARAFGMEPMDKKYIFIYIRPITEDREPNEFANADIGQSSREAWAFVKMDFDKENAFQKAWGVKTAPVCIGADLHGNDFFKVGGVSIDAVRSVLRNTPEAVTKYETKLKSDFHKAMDLLKTDEDRGAKLLVDLCLAGKNGYKEATEAQAKLADLTDGALRKSELAASVSLDVGVDYLEELVKIYRNTPPGARAEIQLAHLEHARGNVQPAIQRLLKVMKYDARVLKNEIEAAAKALDEISKAGEGKLEAALSAPDRTQAREAARKLAKDYAGTETGKRALDASK